MDLLESSGTLSCAILGAPKSALTLRTVFELVFGTKSCAHEIVSVKGGYAVYLSLTGAKCNGVKSECAVADGVNGVNGACAS